MTEIDILRERVAALEAEQRRQALRHRLILQASLEGYHLVAGDGRILECNDSFANMLGYTCEELRGMFVREIDTRPREQLSDITQQILHHRAARFETRHRHRDGREIDVEVSIHRFDLDGEPCFVGFSHSIAERLAAEAERAAMQAERIAAQAATIRELSAPLIPVEDGVLVVPLIGRLDQGRASDLLEVLLAGVAERRARAVILDVTGTPGLDAAAAAALVKVVRAVRLLGAAVVITGIRPDVASALVGLGIDTHDLITLGSLQSGLRHVQRR
mgnify:CR=1 FL=1